MLERKLTTAEASSFLLMRAFSTDNSGLHSPLHSPLASYLKFGEYFFQDWISTFKDPDSTALLVDTVERVLSMRTSETVASRLLLTDTEAQTLRVRYGIEDGQVKTQKETGQNMGGVLISTVAQREMRGLRKLMAFYGFGPELKALLPKSLAARFLYY